jgi:hypothetical protein
MSDLIPEAKRAAVDRALNHAFGTSVLDAITPLRGGMSGAAVFRIRLGGIAYLLRIEGARDELRDPGRWYGCMRQAAAACLAPRVYYADAEDGVAVIDYVAERSLALDYTAAKSALLTELGLAARVMHGLAPFPPLLDYLDAMDRLIGQFHANDLFAPAATATHFARYGALADVYRRLRPELAPSHNDLNPGNILYDGARLWLVDWESAFQVDRWVDVAALANWYCRDEAEADAVLAAYLGRPPTPEARARLFLARQINHVFYAVVFFNLASAQKPGARIEGWPAASALEDFVAGPPDSWEGRVSYGQARLDAALRNLSGPRFEQAAGLAV